MYSEIPTSAKFLGSVVYSSCFNASCSVVFSLPTVFIGDVLVSGASLLPQLSLIISPLFLKKSN
jgi:hypothetical protein